MNDVKVRAKVHPRGSEPSILNGGLLKLELASHDYAVHLSNKLKGYDGRVLEVTFSDAESWTNRMNRLFHALVRDIVKSGLTDYWEPMKRAPASFEEVKAFCKIEFGEARVEKVGELTWIQSWTTFNKKQALLCIDNMIDWCLNKGVDIDAQILEWRQL